LGLRGTMTLPASLPHAVWTGLRRDPDLQRRVAVTAGILLAYWTISYVPVPGVSIETFANALTTGRWTTLTVTALGVAPLVTALCIVELCRLTARAVGSRAFALYGSDARLKLWVRLLGIFCTAVIALSWHSAFAQSKELLAIEPGRSFLLLYVLSIVATTALLVWMADRITAAGLGSGLWLMLCASGVSDAYFNISANAGAFARAELTRLHIAALAAFSLAAVAILTTLYLARPDTDEKGDLLWPPLIAYVLIEIAQTGAQRLGGDDVVILLAQGTVAWALAFATLTLLIALLRARVHYPTRRGYLYGSLVALAIIAVVMVDQVLMQTGAHPIIAARDLIVATTVMLVAMPLFFRNAWQPRWPLRRS